MRPTLKQLVTVVAATAAAVAASAGTAVAAKDPVLAAINAAASAGSITSQQSVDFRSRWRASARIAKRLEHQRRSRRAEELGNARAIAIGLARRGKLSGDRLPGVMASVRASTYVFDRMQFPQSEERRRLPFDEVIFAYYPGAGMQFQPLFTFTEANVLYLAQQNDALKRLVDRMEELAVERSGYLAWEYSFPYAGSKPPWASGMAQGVGLQVLARTYTRTGDRHYLDLGARVLKGFQVGARNGGVATSEQGGRWYLLYAFNPEQRVLNGHLQALIGLAEYEKTTEDETAALRLDEGIRAVLPNLKRFDTGAWSRYTPSQEADLNYHDVMTQQLERLAELTDVPEFADYAHRFATYRTTPPSVVPLVGSFPALYPAPLDGFRDSVRIPFFLDKRGTVRVSILDRSGRAIRTMTARGGRGRHAVVWDGHRVGGRPAAVDTYSIAVHATDLVGNRRDSQFTAPLEVRRDTTPPEVTGVEVRPSEGGSVVKMLVMDAESPRAVARIVGPGHHLLGVAIGHGRMRVALDESPRVVGKGTLRVVDTSGNTTVVAL